MSAGPTRYSRQKFYRPSELGLNGVTIAAEKTSTVIDITGYTKLTLTYNLTRVAATAVTTQVDTRPNSTSTWAPIQVGAVSAGTRTLSDLTDSKTVSASDEWSSEFDVSNAQARVRVTGTAASTDTLVVFGVLSV